MFTAFFGSITMFFSAFGSLFSAFNRVAKTLDNLAAVGEEVSGEYHDDSAAQRAHARVMRAKLDKANQDFNPEVII